MRSHGLKLEGSHHFVISADILEPLTLVLCKLRRRHGSKSKVRERELENTKSYELEREIDSVFMHRIGCCWRELNLAANEKQRNG